MIWKTPTVKLCRITPFSTAAGRTGQSNVPAAWGSPACAGFTFCLCWLQHGKWPGAVLSTEAASGSRALLSAKRCYNMSFWRGKTKHSWAWTAPGPWGYFSRQEPNSLAPFCSFHQKEINPLSQWEAGKRDAHEDRAATARFMKTSFPYIDEKARAVNSQWLSQLPPGQAAKSSLNLLQPGPAFQRVWLTDIIEVII